MFQLVPIECYMETDMLTKVTASVLLPIAIVALGLLLRIIPRLRTWAILSPTAFYVFVYFIYAPISLTIMLSFRCKEFDDGTEVIAADMQVSCQSDRYGAVMSTAGYGGLAVYAAAPGLLFLAVLWPHRAILAKDPELRTDEETVKLDATSFLHASYRPPVWWFESFDILRRLAMCGGINIWFDQDSTTGIYITVICTTLAYGFNCGWMPFVHDADNYLSLTASLLIFVELLTVMARRSGMFETNGWSDDGMSLMLIGLNVVWFLALVASVAWNATRKTPEGGGDAKPETYEDALKVVKDQAAAIAERDREIGECDRKIAALEKKSEASTPGKKSTETRYASRMPTSRV
jgi:hypothetical protein